MYLITVTELSATMPVLLNGYFDIISMPSSTSCRKVAVSYLVQLRHLELELGINGGQLCILFRYTLQDTFLVNKNVNKSTSG